MGKTNFGDLSIDEQKKDRFYVNRLSDDAVRTSQDKSQWRAIQNFHTRPQLSDHRPLKKGTSSVTSVPLP